MLFKKVAELTLRGGSPTRSSLRDEAASPFDAPSLPADTAASRSSSNR
jgi:hypothetical protein